VRRLIISKRFELVKLCHKLITRSGPVYLDTVY